MGHEESYKTDPEYAHTYDVLLKEGLSLEKILEVVVKSNGLIGVGIISLTSKINKQLDELAVKGY